VLGVVLVLALLAAGLVAWFASPWPDIVIGSAMALLFLRSAFRVIAEAVSQLRASPTAQDV
jgi:divalent metal cation (Fe/Co/Zn/Cd) transporter